MRRRTAILLVAIALWGAAIVVTWGAATHRAWTQTESMLDYAMLDLDATLIGAIDTMLMRAADLIAADLGAASAVPHSRAAALAARYGVDELNVADRNGTILSSNEKRLIGVSMADKPKSAEFLVLTNGVRHAFSQPFRRGAHNPEALRKYVGVAFPGGEGYVQVGLDETHVTKMLPSILDFIFDGWLLGEKGFFLCADMGDGHLISNPARHRDQAKFLSETGYDPTAPGVVEDGSTTFRTRLFGTVHDCRAMVFCGHRVVAALPPAEFYTTRTLYVVTVGLVLFLVLGLFVALLRRIDRDSARLQEFYTAEEGKREEEMALGRTIQSAALPSDFPENESVRLNAAMNPAREVGGDFYDFFTLDETHQAFLVADVSGKGVTGALYMMTAKTLLKDTLLADPDRDPGAALTRVNTELCRNNPAGMFLTAWVGVLDIDTGRVLFANAGHNPPLHLCAGKSPAWIRGRSGCPLACFEGVRYKTLDIALSPGDALFLYTDGVTETMDASGALFGEERLAKTLADAQGLAAPATGTTATELPAPVALNLAVQAAADTFAAGAPQSDDITVLCLQWLSAPERYTRTFPAATSSLAAAAAFAEERLDAAGCPLRAKTQLLVALDEVLSNVVRCSGASGIAVDMHFSRSPRSVALSISDDGKPFDPLRVPPPDTSLAPEDRPIGGLGLLLLRKTMDELAYRYLHGRNILTLRKSFAPLPPTLP